MAAASQGNVRRQSAAPAVGYADKGLSGALQELDVRSEVERGEAVESRSADAEVQALLHDRYGNVLVQDAIAGAAAGFGDVVVGDLALTWAGVGAEGGGLATGSNEAAQSVMRQVLAREAEGNGAGGSANTRMAMALSRAGRELPTELRERLERATGHDLGDVRVFTDTAANDAAAAVAARAFTLGTDIVFGRGEFRPGSPSGEEIIAHEVQHVVQHLEGRSGRATAVENGVPVTRPGDAVEREATDFGRSFSHGAFDGAALDAEAILGDAAVGAVEAGGAGESGGAVADAAPASEGAVARQEADDKDKKVKNHYQGTGKTSKGTDDSPPNVDGNQAGKGGGGTKKAGGGSTSTVGGGGGGGGDASALKAQVETYNTQFEASSQNLPKTNAPQGNPQENSTEDHAKKISQYNDGVDGIADQIGDLDAFDDLCDAVSDEDQAAQRTALAKVRASKPFKMLSQMWQGAEDGGEDKSTLEKIFDSQFNGRGFWGSTEKAFDLVCKEAKAAAAEDAAAKAAKKKAKDAERDAKKKKTKDGQGKDTGGTGKGNGPPGQGEAGAAGEGEKIDINAVVERNAASLPAFDKLRGVSDEQFDEISTSVAHYDGLGKEFQRDGKWSSRTSEILGAFWEGGSEGFLEGFKESATWGTIAALGDRVLGGFIEKGLGEKVPVVGPIIALVMDNPFSGDYWSLDKKGGVGHQFAEGIHHFAHIGEDFKGWDKAAGLEKFGMVLAAVADLLSGLYQFVNQIARLIGTLSALALVAGAVLIAVGLALVWFFGVGAPLIAAGGWLVDAGMILGDIALALMPIAIAISALAAIFRMAAAFLVPADMYADQLVKVGESSKEFGEQAGMKAGDAAAQSIEHATAKDHGGNHEEGGHGHEKGEHEGANDSKTVKDKVSEKNENVKKLLDERQKKREAKKKAQEEAKKKAEDKKKETEKAKSKDEHGKKHDEHGGKHDEHGGKHDEHGKTDEHGGKSEHEKRTVKDRVKQLPGDFLRRLGEQAHQIVELRTNLRRAYEGFQELGHISSKEGSAGAMKSAQERIEGAEKSLKDLEKTAKESSAHIDELTKKLTSPEAKELSAGDLRKLQSELKKSQSEFKRAHQDALKLEERIKNYEKLLEDNGVDKKKHEGEEEENAAVHDESGAKDSLSNKQREAEARRKAAKEEVERLQKEHKTHQEELQKAQKELAEAKKQQETLSKEAQTDPLKKSKTAAADVDAHRTSLQQSEAKVKDLQSRADAIEKAQQTQKQAADTMKFYEGKEYKVDGKRVKILEVTPEGVKVTGAGGERMLNTRELAQLRGNDRVRAARDQYNEAQKLLNKETERGKVNPTDAAEKLRTQADWVQKNEIDTQKTRSEQDHWDQREKDAQAWRDHEKKTGDNGSAVDAAQKRYDAAKKQADETKGKLDEQKKEVTEQDKLAKEYQRQRAIDKRVEKNREKLFHGMHKAFDWLLAVTGLEEKLEHLHEQIDHLIHGKEGESEKKEGEGENHEPEGTETHKDGDEKGEKQEDDGGQGATGGETDQELPGEREGPEGGETEGEEPEGEGHGEEEDKLSKELKEIGSIEAAYEKLVAMAPPVSLAEVSDHRTKATKAAERYRKAHDWAFKVYQAEQAVGALVEETGAMAESGKPLLETSKGQEAPLEKSKDDEQQRGEILGGAETDEIEGPDDRMSGIVVDLITKLADHQDRFSDKPETGGADGEDMSKTQDTAATQSKDRTKDAQAASDQQRQFLDEAVALRQAQESEIDGAICSLEEKQAEEKAILDDIRARKVEALQEEAEAREETEHEAEAFNEGYEQLSEWSEKFEEAREELKSEGE